MKVLVIPEDFRNDQYILKPLFVRLFGTSGIRAARVNVCQDPRLGGVGEALKTERIREIVEQYPMIDVFILCVDRDGDIDRRAALDHIENTFGPRFLAVNAWEEIETWVLAGVQLPSTWRWSDVRSEIQVKEEYFAKLVADRELTEDLGQGRQTLGEEASRRIDTIRQKCPEDFDALARRLENLP